MLHINTVRNSQRTNEIRAIKIWRNIHNLDFPSIYIELTVLQALKNRLTSTLSANVLHTLQYIDSSLTTARIEDPANTNNIVSDDLTITDKRLIAAQATQSAQQPYWRQIIW